MATFKFDIRDLFPQPIVKVSSNLLPHYFRGDKRQAAGAAAKIAVIIDRLGELSAKAQQLNKPITTAEKLRITDNQVVYLMADLATATATAAECVAQRRAEVVGLLKIGPKDLYLFDELGQSRRVNKTPCILDFYIHDTRQRNGLGKILFETMLSVEEWQPVKIAIDRPSEKLLAFLKKHYGLERILPQANHFVLYAGFFGDGGEGEDDSEKEAKKKTKELGGRSQRMLMANRYL